MEVLTYLPALAIVFWFGASIGSFLNVVVYRLPAGLSVLRPPSRCPYCHHRLKPYENVPLFGWLWLRGRCSQCRRPISWRYPAVEAATGSLFLLVFLTSTNYWQTFGYWAFMSWLVALALIDLDTLTLPNPLTQSGLLVGLGFQAVHEVLAKPTLAGVDHPLWGGILGAVVGIWLLDAIALIGSITFGRAAMGAGDAKLAAMMGAWLGWKYLLLGGFLACALGAFAGGSAIALGLLERRQPMPFGPFLALGGAIAAIWGETLLNLYLRLFFPLAA